MKLLDGQGPDTFQSGFILMQSLLSSSILYATETMYNTTEDEYKCLESIEESLMRMLYGTGKCCPSYILYLEGGQIKARYKVKQLKLIYLQYILKEPDNSTQKKMFLCQEKYPVKGDWASEVRGLLKLLNIKLTDSEIKNMSRNKWKNIVKEKIKIEAFENLIQTQRKYDKGSSIEYKLIQMADYLEPNSGLSLEDQREMFSLRTRMNYLPINFGKDTYCETGCGQALDNEHIINCEILNNGKKPHIKYNLIMNGTLNEKNEVLKIFQTNIKIRKQFLSDSV